MSTSAIVEEQPAPAIDRQTMEVDIACAGSSEFLRLQSKLTTCLSGCRLAKDRAAETVGKVMIPEALDYPA